ncbi:metal-dependent transcriptional regulator [Mongoliitalea daihaiensis]|uniref:metal-dependent transcriptional regulator n=1 Tax=Mongoliitalea daihaiensis TaxID=2782006 RepID=UPI001F3953DC|nr:metal-dependent transcriptional regulator [Mongoliitalea daihaiensis]UJP64100.1 metal-dependent transcriptional regulator [Mongoliitalea daihaiensis]
MNLTYSEEKYLKAIYEVSEGGQKSVATNDIAAATKTKAASVSDMLRKLSEKEMIEYRKYYGVNLTDAGKKIALMTIRKQRLWEVFLVEKLKFSWDEVSAVADQLEHIQSQLMIRRLDEYLGYPKFDPHGDPIPDEFGDVRVRPRLAISEMDVDATGQVVAVKDNSPAFLRYLDKIGVYIGARVKILEKVEFDGSVEILVDSKKTIFMSKDMAINIMIMT